MSVKEREGESEGANAFPEERTAMGNRTIGAVFLVTSGVCCTLGVVGTKLAAALGLGMFHLAGHGGRMPPGTDAAKPGWMLTAMVAVLAVLGVRFLFTRDDNPG